MDGSVWIVATVGAALCQTLRNALQRSLVDEVGIVGATYVRFLFGLPFAVLFLAAACALTGQAPPLPTASGLGWIAIGAAAQIAATALMLAAMRRRSFVVVTAYTKTEPVQVLLVAVAVLGEVPSPLLATAVLTATLGVVVLSWPPASTPLGDRPLEAAALGIGAGALFAVAAVAYRGGILASGGEGNALVAIVALVVALALQASLLALWLLAADRRTLASVASAWRPSLTAGLMGALASLGWFIAFALAEAAAVRTLALVELLFALILSRRLFRERAGVDEVVGLVLLSLGVGLVLWTS